MPVLQGRKGEATTLPRIVLVDANVFFAPRMRDLFMHLHEAEILNIHWTKEIEGEWTRNVIAKQNADPKGIKDCLKGMRDAAEGWEVVGYSKHSDKFEPVDAKDRHVAAAAYKLSLEDWPGQPVALITNNVKDFPQTAFEGTLVTRYSMAGYLDALYAEEPEVVASVTEGCKKKLKTPKLTREEYVAVLIKNGCLGLAQAMSVRWAVECPVITKEGTLYYASDALTKRVKQPKTPAKRRP
jgi:hypothetical protein